jgi:hypothetical protein
MKIALQNSLLKKWNYKIPLFEKVGRMGGRKNEMEGVNLFKIYCMHVWNYHNEYIL